MSRGSWNITTWFVAGSIETVISVSVLWAPPCSSAPMSRMLSRALPSHGGISEPDASGPRLGGSETPGSSDAPEAPGELPGSHAASGSKMHDAVPDSSRS